MGGGIFSSEKLLEDLVTGLGELGFEQFQRSCGSKDQRLLYVFETFMGKPLGQLMMLGC
jgi:hypothetical protein